MDIHPELAIRSSVAPLIVIVDQGLVQVPATFEYQLKSLICVCGMSDCWEIPENVDALVDANPSRRSLSIRRRESVTRITKAGRLFYPWIRQLSTMDFSLEASHDHCNDHALLSSVAEILDNVQMEPSLTDLTIEIVGFRSDACAAFGYKLSGMTFRILHSFTSRSLSHDDISRFAIRQPNLEYLTIGGSECEGVCPLQLLEHCGRIVSLTGHGVASCVSSIVPGNPVTDVWILDASRTYGEDCQFMNVLLKLRESSASITHLTLSFPAAQLDILSLILIAAPQVEMLDLRESDSAGRCRARRPWNDYKKWASQLQMLQKLQFLELSTRSFVLPKTFLPDLWFPRPRLPGRCPMHISIEHRNKESIIDYDWALNTKSLEYHAVELD